uniref:Protein farnesyltransferase subunit beta n=1 Tax=Clastoptera arizonana TaxID=38151 RepID=A0A1B6DT40_9HEMI
MENSQKKPFLNEHLHIDSNNIVSERFDDEGVFSQTSHEQITVEKSIERIYNIFLRTVELDPEAPVLEKNQHIAFLKQYLVYLPNSYQCLDASRPWLCYWIVHSLFLLNSSLAPDEVSNIIQFLGRCQNEDGGFGGGPGQMSHLAATYAAVNTFCILGTKEAYAKINREGLRTFLWSVKNINGAFNMHVNGEADIRGVYCALSVARLTNTFTTDLFENSAEWIISCQTYEGGFSGAPGMEAHGGYAFCGIAALSLLGKENLCDMKALLRWSVNRQMRFEGGFQGRTNKLVDGCYSFWQGGALAIIQRLLHQYGDVEESNWLFNSRALQNYITICCQYPMGGLIDKPNKPRDLYHTCYNLSGLSVCQHLMSGVKDVVGSLENLLVS